MVPRKVAKRLFAELRAQIPFVDLRESDDYDDAVTETLRTSPFVLRGKENAEQKARRYLVEGRLTIKRVDRETGWIIASARGETGSYDLGFDPSKQEWRCTCATPRKTQCSHIRALRLVVDQPTVRPPT